MILLYCEQFLIYCIYFCFVLNSVLLLLFPLSLLLNLYVIVLSASLCQEHSVFVFAILVNALMTSDVSFSWWSSLSYIIFVLYLLSQILSAWLNLLFLLIYGITSGYSCLIYSFVVPSHLVWSYPIQYSHYTCVSMYLSPILGLFCFFLSLFMTYSSFFLQLTIWYFLSHFIIFLLFSLSLGYSLFLLPLHLLSFLKYVAPWCFSHIFLLNLSCYFFWYFLWCM